MRKRVQTIGIRINIGGRRRASLKAIWTRGGDRSAQMVKCYTRLYYDVMKLLRRVIYCFLNFHPSLQKMSTECIEGGEVAQILGFRSTIQWVHFELRLPTSEGQRFRNPYCPKILKTCVPGRGIECACGPWAYVLQRLRVAARLRDYCGEWRFFYTLSFINNLFSTFSTPFSLKF